MDGKIQMKAKRIVLVIFALGAFLSFESFDDIKDSLPQPVDSSTFDTSPENNDTPDNSTPLPQIDPADGRADPDAANWDIETLDTAKNAEYLSAVEKDVILEMNKVRTNPKKYAELYIQPILQYYNGNNFSEPGKITIRTNEGKRAAEACISALSRAPSVGLLFPEQGLFLAAKDHVVDQSKTGQTGHNGSDRSTPVIRATRHGKMGSIIGENIAYGSNAGRGIVTDLLIDDGVPSRGHRINIMKSDYTQTGASCGIHSQYRNMCVIVYANGFVSN